MFQRISLTLLAVSFSYLVNAQVKPAPTPGPQAKPTVTLNPLPQAPQPKPLNLKKINSDLSYAIVVDKPTSPFPQEGDLVKLHMISVANNRVIYSTRQANKNKPVEFGVNKPTFNADIVGAIMKMTPGDSMVCVVDGDAIYKNTKNQKPDFIKSGDKIQYFIKLVSIKTKAQMQKEQQAAFAKQQAAATKKMQAEQAKIQKQQEIEGAKLVGKEDAELQAYFKTNNLNPRKTASGLYYEIVEKGEGDMPVKGDTCVMNYTGRLINETKFDSNVDTAFHHVQPFEFPLGAGRVIKGWDEGVSLLPKGSKAVLYLPSRLGYGPGAQAKIPANSILIFDVELKDIKPQPIN